jgi:hypothetical protein
VKKIKIASIFILIFLLVLFLSYFSVLNIYTQYRNEKALSKIAAINSFIAPIFDNFIKEIEEKTDWKVVIVSGYRTEAEQAILKKMNTKTQVLENLNIIWVER